MKGLSVKAKMTLWYGAFLIVIAAAVAAALVFATRYIAGQDIKEELKEAVEANAPKIEVESGRLNISNHLENYKDGKYLLVYEEGNFLISGVAPEDFPEDLAFRDGKLRRISSRGTSYYVYDHKIKTRHFVDVWLRGISAADLSVVSPAVDRMTVLLFIFLPLLIIIAIAGGFIITRRAFRPLGDIADTAREISTGRDLSKRIPDSSPGHQDELLSLVTTFNSMLDRLDSAFRSETQFSDNASHELRTPVAVIMAQCEEAKANAKTPEEYEKALDTIFTQARNMSGLLSQLLALARADKGAQHLEREDADVSFILNIVCEELQSRASEKNISLTRELEEDILCFGDQTMLTILFMNLISNAVRYGKEGGSIHVSLRGSTPSDTWPEYAVPADISDDENDAPGSETGFWSSAEEDDMSDSGRFLIACIKDDGIGIAKEHLPLIWGRFYQVDPSRSKKDDSEKGVGLGLSMVRWIVQEHGGQITCESTPGCGTAFTVYLPLSGGDSFTE